MERILEYGYILETLVILLGRDRKDKSFGSAPPGWEDLEERYYTVWQAMFDHYSSEPPEDLMALVQQCPWKFEGLQPELAGKQLLSWFILDRNDPRTGRTPLRDYVEREVKNSKLAEMLLWAEHPVWAEFRILRTLGNMIEIEYVESGKVITLTVTPSNIKHYKKGRYIECAIHPWKDGWKATGIILFSESPEEVLARTGLIISTDYMMGLYEEKEVKKSEKIILRDSSTLSSILNKYPSQWVDGIYKALGFPKGGKKRQKVKKIAAHLKSRSLEKIVVRLPRESGEALSLIMERGGSMPLGTLERRFSARVGLFWSEKPPTTPVGRLRALGLVVVGKVPRKSGRMYKTAIVPKELRNIIADVLKKVTAGR